MAPTECQKGYDHIGTVELTDKQICAGRGETDTCAGDSGGPLLASNPDGSWTVVGITSFGVGCGNQIFPGVYTKVSEYMDWIDART